MNLVDRFIEGLEDSTLPRDLVDGVTTWIAANRGRVSDDELMDEMRHMIMDELDTRPEHQA